MHKHKAKLDAVTRDFWRKGGPQLAASAGTYMQSTPAMREALAKRLAPGKPSPCPALARESRRLARLWPVVSASGTRIARKKAKRSRL